MPGGVSHARGRSFYRNVPAGVQAVDDMISGFGVRGEAAGE